MDSARWKKIKEIIEESLEQTPESRAFFVETACGADFELLADVRSFLDYEKVDNGFLDKNLISSENLYEEKNSPFIGRQIGKYEIIREIGSGGMGIVFLAERRGEEFSQKVAVKILRQSFFSQTTYSRFLQERHILAGLQNPFIAQMFDGGTTDDGTPYFVMEYIEGLPITEYTEKNGLSVEEKLKLFLKVCRAVSYAHRNLIIHRDLKPDNILITENGTPKLLDFGIAKLLSEGDINTTLTKHQAFTPEYASPEQIKGEKVSTATDVYSLGMILYKLLTGAYPYRVKTESPMEIALSVCQTEPVPPSTAGSSKVEAQNLKSLKGDLDSIILKALEKKANARYESVEQFSADIENYLNGLPVKARPNGRVYRTEKFLRRNRIAAGITLIAVLSLFSGAAATVYQAQIAKREKVKAERRAENIRKISNALIVDVHDAIRDLPGSLPARQIILQRAVEQLDELSKETENDPALLEELAKGYQNVGEMYQALGKIIQAEKSHRKASKIYEQLAKENPAAENYRERLAASYGFQGEMAYLRGDMSDYEKFYKKAVSILENLTAENPQNIELQNSLWTAYHSQIRVFYLSGYLKEADRLSRRYVRIAENIARINGENSGNLFRIYVSRNSYALVLYYLEEYEKAAEQLKSVVKANEKLISSNPNDTALQYGGWAFNKRLGEIYLKTGNFEKSRKNLNKALLYMKNLKEKNSQDAGYRRNFSYTLISLAKLDLSENKMDKAFKTLQQAVEISEDLYRKDQANGEIIGDLAQIYRLQGEASVNAAEYRKGLEFQEKSIKFYEQFLNKSPQNIVIETEYIEAAVQTSVNYRRLNQTSEAEELFLRAYRKWQKIKKNKTLIFSETKKIKDLMDLTAKK